MRGWVETHCVTVAQHVVGRARLRRCEMYGRSSPEALSEAVQGQGSNEHKACSQQHARDLRAALSPTKGRPGLVLAAGGAGWLKVRMVG